MLTENVLKPKKEPQYGNVKRYQNKNRLMLLAGILGAIVKTFFKIGSVVFPCLNHRHRNMNHLSFIIVRMYY